MKKILVLITFLICIPVQAFEDCIIYTDAKISDINIKDNDIIDVCPIFTIMNEKNTLFVKPLKVGSTDFSILKNGKKEVVFHVNVTENSTKISEVEGFYSFTLDTIYTNNNKINHSVETNELGFPIENNNNRYDENNLEEFIDLPPETLGDQ